MRVAIEAELDAPRSDSTVVLHESLRALDRLESTIESMLALARHDERTPGVVRRRRPRARARRALAAELRRRRP